jgi:hypothetical protein
MGLLELIKTCQGIEYTPVTDDDDKTDWDYIHESIWIALKDPVQTKTLVILANMFYPIKLISKMLLRSYIHGASNG